MGATIQQEANGMWTLRVTGILRKAELDAVQAAAIKDAPEQGTAKVLVIAEDFHGWERGADWADISFFVEYGDRMEKIAIVADSKWEADLLAFSGAGIRRTPVRFFPIDQLDQARSWLG